MSLSEWSTTHTDIDSPRLSARKGPPAPQQGRYVAQWYAPFEPMIRVMIAIWNNHHISNAVCWR